MGAVLSEEGCFGREPRPWEERWEALKLVLEAELEAKRALKAEQKEAAKEPAGQAQQAEPQEAVKQPAPGSQAPQATRETVLLGRVQGEGGKAMHEKEQSAERPAELVN